MEKTSEKHIQGNVEIPERQHPLSTADDRGRWRAGDAATTETVYYGFRRCRDGESQATISLVSIGSPQRELIQWHSKLCTNMNHVQELMRNRHYKIPDGNDLVHPPILFTKNATTWSCLVPRCLTCGLSSQKLHSTNVKTSRAIPAKDSILKFNQYKPGDKVFTDQFVLHTPGWHLDGFGNVGPERSLH